MLYSRLLGTNNALIEVDAISPLQRGAPVCAIKSVTNAVKLEVRVLKSGSLGDLTFINSAT